MVPSRFSSSATQMPADEAGRAGDEVVQGPSTLASNADGARETIAGEALRSRTGLRAGRPACGRPRPAVPGISGPWRDASPSKRPPSASASRRHPAALGESGRDPGGGRRGRVDRRGRGARAHRGPAARARAHASSEIREAGQRGPAGLRLHRGAVPRDDEARALARATLPSETGLEPALIERFWTSIGLPAARRSRRSRDEDIAGAALRRVGARRRLPAGGLPPALPRLWPGALPDRRRRGAAVPPLRARAAHARGRARARRWPRRWSDLARDLLPLASPMMDYVHQRFLQHFVEQDVVGHMEVELEDERRRSSGACAWRSRSPTWPATRASPRRRARRRRCRSVERFVEGVTNTLPDDARVVKTIGDEVMVVGPGRAARSWTGRSGFTRPVRRAARAAHRHPLGHHSLPRRRLLRPRREPRLARGGARARRRGARHGLGRGRRARRARTSAFEEIGQVKLKGFDEPRQLCRARPARDPMEERALEAARDSGLIRAGRAAARAAVGRRGLRLPARRRASASARGSRALHVNYGLRAESDADEALCRGSASGWTCR